MHTHNTQMAATMFTFWMTVLTLHIYKCNSFQFWKAGDGNDIQSYCFYKKNYITFSTDLDEKIPDDSIFLNDNLNSYNINKVISDISCIIVTRRELEKKMW